MRGVLNLTALATTALSVCVAASNVSPGSRLPDGAAQYRIKLGPFIVPPTRSAGIVIKARVNGGPILRLLLDSGAQYVVLDRKAAAKSGCSGGTDLDLIGAGATDAAVVKMHRAQTVQIGDLMLRDIPVLVENRTLADGIQGVLPLSVFAGFLIRLDIPGKNLDLLPYTPDGEEPAGALQSVSSNRVLFVRGTVNERTEGYFLFDTGAAYSAISRKLARELNISESLADRIPLQGGTTSLEAPLLRGSVRLRLGSREVAADPVVAVDLSAPSRFHGIEIEGLLGYPAFCASVLTVSYRKNYIRIEPR
jgi:predicted aspartyl protease